MRVACQVSEQTSGKTVIVKNQQGDLPFPWSEKDPYKLPVSIDRVQKLLLASGRAWACIGCAAPQPHQHCCGKA